MFTKTHLLLICYLSFFGICHIIALEHKIGIVGSGISGSATSYFINQLFDDSKITVFGTDQGRLSSSCFENDPPICFESGGSIIHPRNQYLVNLTSLFGLKKRESNPDEDHIGTFGLHDGKEFVFESASSAGGTGMNMLWRYGSTIVTARELLNDMLDSFDKIYTKQEKMQAFETVESLLDAMSSDFTQLTRKPLRNHLVARGVDELFVNEFGTAALRTNYCSELDGFPAFAGMVSLAGGVDPGLWSVEGGNAQLPIELLRRSTASHVGERVVGVARTSYGFVVTTEDGVARDFDAVIIAFPLHKANLKHVTFQGVDIPDEVQIPFRRVFANFVRGKLNKEKFPNDHTEIFAIQKDHFFNSIGKKTTIDGDAPPLNPVYKVFTSNDPLTPQQTDELFSHVDSTVTKFWLAYPEYDLNLSLPSFELTKGLFYVNAIEHAASAMEMSMIGAKNVALLVENYLKSLSTKDEL